MHRRPLALLVSLATVGAAPALAQEPAPRGLPPLIDREVLFGDPEIAGGQISPDGRWISFLKPYRGQMNVWVKGIAEPFDAARPVTADTARPIPGYFWSEDGRHLLFVQDRGGNENFHVYAVDPAAPAAELGVPAPRDLTPYGAIQAQIVAVPEATPGRIVVALNDRDPAKHDVYRVELATGERELLFRNDAGIVGFTTDVQGNLRLGTRMGETGQSEILRIEEGAATPLLTLPCDIFQGCGPVRFHKDGRRVYLNTRVEGEDLTSLVLHDLQTGRQEVVERDPEGRVDFGGAEFSDRTDELLATYYVGDRLRVYPKDPQFARDYQTVRAAVGEGDVYFGSSTHDEQLHVVSVTSDVDPGATYLYDRGTGKVELLYRPRPDLPTEHLARMEPVRYRARDGVEIPAYLTLPRGVEPRKLPVVLLVHGGPWSRDTWGYDSYAQFLANRGYAVLQPNFRGSTGYGARFLDLGNDEWGTGAMQHDLTDAARWLIQEGIADPERVAIMGGSYGGYATLAGLAFTPELYAAGVDIVGPSNLITLLESIPPYWAPIKKAFDRRLGDLDDPEDVERLKAQSPLFSATRIRKPLLVIQGANDPRVKKAESDQIVVALRDLGREVEYLVAPDEGHGFRGRENRLAMIAAIEPFLAEHLGGRVQESVPPEIRERLAALTVGLDTLELPPAVAVDAGAAMPAFRGDRVRPQALTYRQTLQLGPQKLELEPTRTVSAGEWEGRAAWVVVEEARSPMGAVVDSVWVDRATLLPLRRSVHQGPATVEVTFSDARVQGSIQAGPQTMPIDAALDAPVLADGAAMQLAVSTLPLEPGYTATLRTFDLVAGRPKALRLEVAAKEQVTVPAGAIEAFRVVLTPEDGGGASTLWVEAAAPHRVLKSVTALPAQMGGGESIAELLGGGR